MLPDTVLPGFEDRVLQRAPEQTLQQLRDVVRRAQHRLDPAGAEQRRRRAVADRSVRVGGWCIRRLGGWSRWWFRPGCA